MLTLQRAQYLLKTVAGEQATVDTALANERALAAQIAAAQAQLEQAQINLGYTEIRAPIDGEISSTNVTEGNVVSPTSGTLANLVSQDPMYVIFPISMRTALELRDRYGPKGGFSAVVIKLRLPTGEIYRANGHLDYVSPTVAQTTDTITLRGVIPNLVHPGMKIGEPGSRELTDAAVEHAAREHLHAAVGAQRQQLGGRGRVEQRVASGDEHAVQVRPGDEPGQRRRGVHPDADRADHACLGRSPASAG